MTTIARLTCWADPARADDVADQVARRLTPRLQQLGLQASSEPSRPSIPGAHCTLWEAASPMALHEVRVALRRDPAWAEALAAIGGQWPSWGGPTTTSFDAELQIYHTVAGPGVRIAGGGERQGSWLTFGVRNGMPYSVVDAAEDAGGRLWLATGWGNRGGVCRFDGEFERLDVAAGLPSSQVLGVASDDDGNVWLATGAGVCLYDGESLTTFTRADGLPNDDILCVHRDAGGMLWAGTGQGLARQEGEVWSAYTRHHGLAQNRVVRLIDDPDGSLWILASTWQKAVPGLTRWTGGRFEDRSTWGDGAAGMTTAMAWDVEGQLWAGTTDGRLGRFDAAGFEAIEQADTSIVDVVIDADGTQWVGTSDQGIVRRRRDRVTRFTTADGLANNQVHALYRDRRGFVWVGTYRGVSRWDGTCVASFTRHDGLPHDGVMCVTQDAVAGANSGDGLWVGTWNGAARWDGKQFDTVEALSGWHVWQVLVDRHGRLWFGGALGRGVMHGDGDRFRLWDRAEDLPCRQVRLLFEDRSGTVWIGTASAGLWRWDGDDLKRLAADGSLDHVVCALQDDDGVLWFGSDGRGLFRYDGGQVTPFTMDDGLPGNGVLCLARDDEARILVGTRAGLCRFDGQTFEPVAGPLLTGTVNAALRDHAGAWWFGCAGGVTRTDGLALQTFTRDDGLVFDEVQALSQDSTGDVWIATEGGLTRCRVHTDPPRVLLDAVLADRRYEPQDKVSVSTSQKLVAFEFSGSSWTTPARRMVFVCRLEGIDDDWRFVDSGRVEYLNLPEGEYRFQVRAVDRDLNYSEPAAVQLIVEPDAIAESLSAVLRERAPQGEFVGTSATLMRVQEQLRLVAPAELTILILGETGTGKGLAARAVHEWGPRPNQPFVHVTCGAMPDSLVESELFGHERGAFTGASQRQLGKVELAAGGTLFLDEIGDLPAAAQAKLLRLLEERTFERVGGTQVLQADVRVVAATNRDLRQMIADGEFRQDLFFRLQGFEIHLPPLRERREDIPLLALYFVGPMAAHLHKPVAEISPAAEASLLRHDWPGNVRELQHAIERAVVVCTGVRIEATDLSLVDSRQTAQAGPPEHDLVTLDENERCHILRAMQETGWRISGAGGAAQLLGVPPSTLRNRMNRLHIHRP